MNQLMSIPIQSVIVSVNFFASYHVNFKSQDIKYKCLIILA